jgi:DNA-binding transcriptional ArsR family regulator
MEIAEAVSALSALGHQPRLEVFRLLVRVGSEGMAAGDIARETATRQNTLSSNLNILSAAGLIASRRDGRSIIYSPVYERIGELITFLVEDCCERDPALVEAATSAEALKRC